MKHLKQFFVFALLVILGTGQMWATKYEYDFSTITNTWYTNSTHTTAVSTGSSNNYTTIYHAGGTTWTADGTNHYFNSGYYMLGKTGATLTLPTYSNEKITSVKIYNSSGCSTNAEVNIYSGTNAASTNVKWATQGSNYTYSISSTYQTSTLKIQVTKNYNAQITKVEINTESTSGSGSGKTDV